MNNIAAMKALWKQAFGDTDKFIDGFFSTSFLSDRCHCLYDGDKLTAALYWMKALQNRKPVAYIYAVATDEAYRGQGLCRRLMTETHEILKQQGYVGAVVVPATAELFSLYEKLGYQTFCYMDSHEIPAGDPIEITPSDPVTNHMARTNMLDGNAVIQSGGLDFLLTYNDFYEAQDCVFCAALEGETVYFQEFLGDRSKLPGVIAAMGGKTGKVRLPGNAPFAMFHPLTTDATLPTYFNMPMD